VKTTIEGRDEEVKYKCQLDAATNPRVLRVWVLQSDAPNIITIPDKFRNREDDARLAHVKNALAKCEFDSVKITVDNTQRRVKLLRVCRLWIRSSGKDAEFTPKPAEGPDSVVEFGWVPMRAEDKQPDGTIVWIEGTGATPATEAGPSTAAAAPDEKVLLPPRQPRAQRRLLLLPRPPQLRAQPQPYLDCMSIVGKPIYRSMVACAPAMQGTR
jgi:hypothetical protein